MKISVDKEGCQGHGMCNMVCPDVFEYDDDGFANVADGMDNVPPELEEAAKLAEIQCPERAIVITQDSSGHKLDG
ncbi:MAG: ferredoxin [Pseudomonadales bacterium]|nr:ferredoxin [Pseudomonadales bacterium]